MKRKTNKRMNAEHAVENVQLKTHACAHR